MRIEKVDTVPPPPAVQIIDDGDAGFATSGTNWMQSLGVGRDGDLMYNDAGTGDAVATWTFTGLDAGDYRVSITWLDKSNRATDSPFTVYDGGSPLATIDVNQELAPSGFADNGSNWNDLGYFTITGDTLVVELSDDADEYIIADAVRIEKVDTVPPSITAPTIANDADRRASDIAPRDGVRLGTWAGTFHRSDATFESFAARIDGAWRSIRDVLDGDAHPHPAGLSQLITIL